MRDQCAPLSVVTKRNRSVPAKTTFALPGYSAMLRTDASGASPFVTAFHVLPKSVVRAMYGAKSPERCESNAAYAVPRDAPDETIRATYDPFAMPAPLVMAALVSRHVEPPSCDTWTLPSSVPTHSTFGSIGDSAMVVIQASWAQRSAWVARNAPSFFSPPEELPTPLSVLLAATVFYPIGRPTSDDVIATHERHGRGRHVDRGDPRRDGSATPWSQGSASGSFSCGSPLEPPSVSITKARR